MRARVGLLRFAVLVPLAACDVVFGASSGTTDAPVVPGDDAPPPGAIGVSMTVPPSVEYALTELGLSLRVPVQALGEWALLNQHTMADARRRFDAAAARA